MVFSFRPESRSSSTGFPNDKKNAIWTAQSHTFRTFWTDRIMNGPEGELDDPEIDEIVRILDRHGKGNTKESEAVARVMIPQGTWRRMFNEIKSKKSLAKALDAVFQEPDSEKRSAAIDKVYTLNEGHRNNLTGQSGNAINAMLAAWDPFTNSSIVSLNDRKKAIVFFSFEGSPDFERDQLLSRWETEVFERRYYLPKSSPPVFSDWADEFLAKVTHPNTRKRYGSSIGKLKTSFTGALVSEISADRIDDYKEKRLSEGVVPATINHDLRVLRRMMRLAERKRLISRNPFLEVDFLKQKNPRHPHILTFEEEEKILAVAAPFLRVLVVLILETGMRSHREALALRWEAINFANDSIRVRESKTRAGIRNIPITARCKTELLRWREILGHNFSPFVFPNMWAPAKPRNDIRHAWEKALKDAGIDHFWIYNLRHTFASRLSAAGVSDLFVAQMIGHNSPGILQKYSKAIDEYRRDAVRKLEGMRAEQSQQRQGSAKPPTEVPKSPREPGSEIRENYYSLTTVKGFPQGKRRLRRCSAHS
jgi:integrase